MQNPLVEYTSNAFKEEFGSQPEHIFLSPGRVNIIGEHVDYNDGYVLPASIDKYICFAVSENPTSNECIFVAKDLNETFSCSVTEELQPVSEMWANYLLGVLHQIQQKNVRLHGLKILFSSTIPIGSGLSSSAALECGFAFILNEIFNIGISKKELALIGQKSEHTFVGVNCGIMDQFASVFGKEDQVMLLDCNTLEHHYFNAEIKGYQWVLFDSCVKHTHLTSGYNDRRADMEHAKHVLHQHYPNVNSFRDVTVDMLDEHRNEIGEIPHKRSNYVVGEIERVKKTAEAMSQNKPEEVGKFLYETHQGLSKEYEVSCDEVDFLVEEAMKHSTVQGARLMGGGFGGCSINLIKDEDAEMVIATVKERYKDAFGIEMKVYPIKIAHGTKRYEI